MSVTPQTTNPLQAYVIPNISPSMSVDGLVVDGVYGYTGVIDSIPSSTNPNFLDPNLNRTDSNNSVTTLTPQPSTSWISESGYGGLSSTPVVLNYTFASATYFNLVEFQVLNTPCSVNLSLVQTVSGVTTTSGLYSASSTGGNNIYTTTDWVNYTFESSNGTILAPANSYLQLTLTRNTQAQQYSSTGATVDIAYSVGVQNLSVKLQILELSDATLASKYNISDDNPQPFPTIVTQNALGFTESYSPVIDSVGTLFSGSNTAFGSYWKCSPQPVKDAVVYFYTQIGSNATQVTTSGVTTMSVTPQTINRMRLDPLYTGCRMNVYYTTAGYGGQTGPVVTTGDTQDTPLDFTNVVWYPVNKDFVLRKGFYELPQINATYLKFEFTSLIPEVYDLGSFDSITRTFNAYPYWVEEYYVTLESNIQDINSNQYSVYSNNNIIVPPNGSNQLTTSTAFGLGNATVAQTNNWPNLSALNNSQMDSTTVAALNTQSYITDPTVSYNLISSSGQYNDTSYSNFLTRRFPYGSTHSYEQLTLSQNWNQAYFTGLKSLSFFYQQTYDQLNAIPGTLIAKNGTVSGFVSQDVEYVLMNPDDYALTPYFNTLDTFSSFSVGVETVDWKSFLTQGQPLSSDISLLNGPAGNILNMAMGNTTVSQVGPLGLSTIYSVSGSSTGYSYGLQTSSYNSANNLVSYYDSNFLIPSGSPGFNWYSISGSTITPTGVVVSGTSISGLTVSGGSWTTAYNFTIPNVYSVSGTTPWRVSLGTAELGGIGYATYVPSGGVNYYFLVNAQTPNANTLQLYTRFVTTATGIIAGTTVSGSVVATSGGAITTLTGTNYSAGTPSNTIQLVISGSTATPYNLYQMGVFNSPTTSWVSSTDRSNMRVSAAARIFLPKTNNGTYQLQLIATNISTGGLVILKSQNYTSTSLPTQTWIDLGISTFTPGNNYTNFKAIIQQINPAVNEQFYVAMLAPFYYPLRFEYNVTSSGSPSWSPITTGINNPNAMINVGSASGIQLRMTALDPNTFLSGVTIVPNYKQNPYYSNIDIDYIGDGMTNELNSRTDIHKKTYFMLNQDPHPLAFSLENVCSTVSAFTLDLYS